MTVYYKLWLSIEEIDEGQSHYQDVDLPTCLGAFDSKESAISIAEHIHSLICMVNQEATK